MVKHGVVTSIIVCHIIFYIMMANLTCFWWLFLLNYLVCCLGSLWRLPLCWFVIDVLKVSIWDVLCHCWKKCRLENGFARSALCRPRYLFLWLNRDILSFSPWWFTFSLGFEGIVIKQLTMGLTFALDLFIFSP